MLTFFREFHKEKPAIRSYGPVEFEGTFARISGFPMLSVCESSDALTIWSLI